MGEEGGRGFISHLVDRTDLIAKTCHKCLIFCLLHLYTSNFLKRFWRTHVPFWGAIGFLVISPFGFQSQTGFCLIHFFSEANVMHIPQDPHLVLHLLLSLWTTLQNIDRVHILPRDITGTSEAGTRNHSIMSSTP